jgi:hypothetical protein
MPPLTTSGVSSDATRFGQPSQASLWAGALVTFAVVFAYRWLTVNFTNGSSCTSRGHGKS